MRNRIVELSDLSSRNPEIKQSGEHPTGKYKRRSDIFKEFFLHLSLLLKKNYLIHKRSKKTTLFQILSPILVSFMIICWQNLANDMTNRREINPPTNKIASLEKCFFQKDSPNDCATLAYGVLVSLLNELILVGQKRTMDRFYN